jgi:hypothetical protein
LHAAVIRGVAIRATNPLGELNCNYQEKYVSRIHHCIFFVPVNRRSPSAIPAKPEFSSRQFCASRYV